MARSGETLDDIAGDAETLVAGHGMLSRLLIVALLTLFASEPSSGEPHANTDANNASQPEAIENKSSFKPSIVTSEDTKGGSEHKEEKCQYEGPKWFASFYCFFAAHEKFWVSFGTLVLAAFTTVLGAATIILARATNRLVSGAQETAKRQLRAYVEAVPNNLVRHFASETLTISFKTKNTGLTPARNVRSYSIVGIMPIPLGIFNFPPLDETALTTSRTVIFPGRDFEQNSPGVLLTDAQIDALGQSEDVGLYLISLILYEDFFDETHETRICVFTRGTEMAASVATSRAQPSERPSGIAESPIKIHHNENYNEAT
jgi:hypothetical protein